MLTFLEHRAPKSTFQSTERPNKVLKCMYYTVLKYSKTNMLRNYSSSINLNVIDNIEKDLKSYDLISMVFLLYDLPEAAFSSILLLEQDEEARGLLRTWAENSIQHHSWKEEFLEALCICQLHNVIFKLGFDLTRVKRCINNTCYVDPMKRVLYKLCEHMTKDNFENLQKALSVHKLDVMEYKSCELVILKIILDCFITVNHAREQKDCEYKIEMLVKIIDDIPGLKSIAEELRDTRNKYCSTVIDTPTVVTNDNIQPNNEKYTARDFDDMFNMIEAIAGDLSFDSNHHIKEDMYPIKNPNRVGVCYIINEEKFQPSAGSSDNCKIQGPLEDRHGSSKDKNLLETTMSSLKFNVFNNDNLDHEQIFNHVRYVLQNKVQQDDSIFMLCILSHGVKGCIVTVDYVKVEIEKIQNLIGEELYKRGIDIPKVMIIQACQGEENPSHIPVEKHELQNELQHDGANIAELCQDKVTLMIPDGPLAKAKKADFLICKATSPELSAYRCLMRIGERVEYNGSIFIKLLCENIQKHCDSKHLCDILVKVNRQIAEFFKNQGYDQFSMSENYLTKDLYLQIPK